MISQIDLDLKEIIERIQSSWRLSGSNILITGAGGFLGYYMSSFFIKYLNDLGIKKLKLITNNPMKRAGLEGFGLRVVDRVPIEITPNQHNLKYLTTKRDKMGHLLNLDEA